MNSINFKKGIVKSIVRVVMKRNKDRIDNKVEVVCIDGVFKMKKEPKGKKIKF